MGNEETAGGGSTACQYPEEYPDDFVVVVARAFLTDHYQVTPALPGPRQQVRPREWRVVMEVVGRAPATLTVKWKDGRAVVRGEEPYPDLCEYYYTCPDGPLELRPGTCLDGRNPYGP